MGKKDPYNFRLNRNRRRENSEETNTDGKKKNNGRIKLHRVTKFKKILLSLHSGRIVMLIGLAMLALIILIFILSSIVMLIRSYYPKEFEEWNNPKKDQIIDAVEGDKLDSDDDYVKMINNMDLSKLYDTKIDNTSNGADKGLTARDWNTGLHPIGDINIYLTLSEILQREEINGDTFPVKVSMESILGTWSVEHYTFGNNPNQIYLSWAQDDEDMKTEGYVGPLQFNYNHFAATGVGISLRSTNTMGYTYITKLENPDLDDSLRAVYGNKGELQRNNGVTNIFPNKVERMDDTVKKISYDDFLNNIKNYGPGNTTNKSTNQRGSALNFSDAFYTGAMSIRMMYEGKMWQTGLGGENNDDHWYMGPLIKSMNGWAEKLKFTDEQKQRLYEAECLPFHLSYLPSMRFVPVGDKAVFNSTNYRSLLPLVLEASSIGVDGYAKSNATWSEIWNNTDDWYLGFDMSKKSVQSGIYDTSKSALARAISDNKVGATTKDLQLYATSIHNSDAYGQGIAFMGYGLRAINRGIRMKESLQRVIKYFYDIKDSDGKYTYRVNQNGYDGEGGDVDEDISIKSDKAKIIEAYKGEVYYPVNYSVFNPNVNKTAAYRWGSLLTQEYNYGLRSTDFHRGVDCWQYNGHGMDQPLCAISDGYVYKFQSKYQGDGSYGNTMLIKCEVNGVVAYIRYAHMQDYDAAKFKRYNIAPFSEIQGQKVKKGQNIGIMGATGQVTGIHLHFEISTESSLVLKNAKDGRFDPMLVYNIVKENPLNVR